MTKDYFFSDAGLGSDDSAHADDLAGPSCCRLFSLLRVFAASGARHERGIYWENVLTG